MDPIVGKYKDFSFGENMKLKLNNKINQMHLFLHISSYLREGSIAARVLPLSLGWRCFEVVEPVAGHEHNVAVVGYF